MTEIFLLIYKNNLSWTAISSDLSLVFVLKLYFVFLEISIDFSAGKVPILPHSMFYIPVIAMQCSKDCQFCHRFQICLQLGTRCWSSLNTKWLSHLFLWHRFCQDVFGPEQQQRVGEVPADAEDVGVGWVVLVLVECLHLEWDCWVVHQLVDFPYVSVTQWLVQ